MAEALEEVGGTGATDVVELPAAEVEPPGDEAPDEEVPAVGAGADVGDMLAGRDFVRCRVGEPKSDAPGGDALVASLGACAFDLVAPVRAGVGCADEGAGPFGVCGPGA